MAAALPFIALGVAGLSAVAGLKSGQATAGGLRSQAMQTRMQAKGEELKYKQQGVAVLDNILQTQATQLMLEQALVELTLTLVAQAV
jgi:hypothetical protein